ncbi:hypothetical protein IQ277_14760 [Nostocales cyanobacterium LEGE 12452]|nr:hypothetical protein [Nostocales cyanobacterium LEGE 12452]
MLYTWVTDLACIPHQLEICCVKPAIQDLINIRGAQLAVRPYESPIIPTYESFGL